MRIAGWTEHAPFTRQKTVSRPLVAFSLEEFPLVTTKRNRISVADILLFFVVTNGNFSSENATNGRLTDFCRANGACSVKPATRTILICLEVSREQCLAMLQSFPKYVWISQVCLRPAGSHVELTCNQHLT